MATKQELEARVAELEAQLASGNSTPALPTDSRIAELESNLAQALEREKSVAEHADSLQAQLRVLGAQKKTAPTQDGVVLAGIKYDIIMQERVGDFIHHWRKNLVHDDELLLVIRKS